MWMCKTCRECEDARTCEYVKQFPPTKSATLDMIAKDSPKNSWIYEIERMLGAIVISCLAVAVLTITIRFVYWAFTIGF